MLSSATSYELQYVFDRMNVVTQILTSSQLQSTFQSSIAGCPITKYKAYSDENLSKAYFDVDNMLLLLNQDDVSNAFI